MITFKQYLSEEFLSEAIVKKWFSKDIDVDAAISVLNSSAKLGLEAIKNGGLIYRGFGDMSKSSTGFMALDSSEGERTSRDTDNLYQIMMSDSKKMDGYPDRSKSFICTTSAKTAKSYGGLKGTYVMIPLGSAKIALSSVSDIFSVNLKAGTFYSGYPENMYNLSKFFMSLGAKMSNSKWINSDVIKTALKGHSQERLLLHWALFVSKFNPSELKFEDKKLQDKWENIIKYTRYSGSILSSTKQILDEMEREMKEGRFTVEGKLAAAYEFIRQNSHDLYTALAIEIMDPVKLKFKLVDYGRALPHDKECWFSGKCIAISLPVFAKILLQLEKQNFPIHASVKKELKNEINQVIKANEKK
jgi:hypothetical protein